MDKQEHNFSSSQSIRLLVVEDCETDRELYKRLLSKDPNYKYEFIYSASKNEALNLYESNKFDCILLDYKLPGFTGLELLREFHNGCLEERPATILLTGGGSEKLAAEAIKIGANEYIPKSELNAEILQGAILNGIRLADNQNEIRKKHTILNNALAEAKLASVAKREFFANISHEIRTPLNGVIGFLELSINLLKDETCRDYLLSARESATHLLALVNDVLDLSKIESGNISLEETSFDLERIIKRAIDICNPQLMNKSQEVAYLIDQRLPATIKSDPLRLSQILVNLLGNAIKFTPQSGGIFIRVALNHKSEVGYNLLFSISDTGIGISATQKGAIFKPYQQAENSIARRFGGTGLGLSIASQLVSLMGGEIWVESKENIGSTFFFTIIAQEGEIEINQITKECSEKSSNNERTANILVAEDNCVNQKLVKAILERDGYNVTLVSNGQEVLDMLSNDDYALLILDIEMPVMDGLSTALEIRASEKRRAEHSKIPIIAVSGRVGETEYQKSLNVGIDAFITKPLNRSELISLVRDFTRQKYKTMDS